MIVDLHIELARLESPVIDQLNAEEKKHLETCPRCRVEAKLLEDVTGLDPETLPQWHSVTGSLAQVRDSMATGMLRGTTIDLPSRGRMAAVAAGGATERHVPTGPDRYQFRELLGKGGMGEVHRVVDTALRRKVAMKVTAERLQGDRDALARFIEEAQVAAQLQHPGIIPVHELGILDDGRAFFTMKEVEGHTLSDVIRDVHCASTDGRWQPGFLGWTFRRLIEAFRRVSETVGYAHARGVCHRDIKPANVMVGSWGEVLVLDWGLAKVLAAGPTDSDPPAGDTHDAFGPRPPSSRQSVETARSGGGDAALMTAAGTVAGTPAYMPPEQALGKIDDVGSWSDVFSLGAVLYTILAGRPPYLRTATQSVLDQVIAGPPPPPEEASAPPFRVASFRARPPIPPN